VIQTRDRGHNNCFVSNGPLVSIVIPFVIPHRGRRGVRMSSNNTYIVDQRFHDNAMEGRQWTVNKPFSVMYRRDRCAISPPELINYIIMSTLYRKSIPPSPPYPENGIRRSGRSCRGRRWSVKFFSRVKN